MNCKPGELAVIVGPADTPNLGRIVRCIRTLEKGEELRRGEVVFLPASHDQFWEVEGRLMCERPDGRECVLEFGPIGDRWLRPIRDPGDDAKDEMLRPLPETVEA